ncbi:Uncharacterised protein [Listeria grayi]|uniref:hypothetical protein n=1 Tax=Listeria grayi TaxID=1641 RepID=UPI000F6E8DCA|nr:hypothetical protein [Listeria grayi]VEI30365.1 Uncharacterised protein [Listeria grayi]
MTKVQINILCSIIVIIGIVLNFFSPSFVGISVIVLAYILQTILFMRAKKK